MLKRTLPIIVILAALLTISLPALAVEDGATVEAYYNSDGSWTYTLEHEIVIRNSAASYAFNIDITVPLMDIALPLYNTRLGEQLLPYPDSVSVDEQGHRQAHYHIDSMPGGGELTLTHKYAITVDSLTYTFDRAAVPDSYSQLEQLTYEDHLLSEPGIESDDPDIIAFAQKAAGEEKNPYRLARSLFGAVNMALDYTDDNSLDQSAAASLKRGSALCEGYANLYIAALRSLGIPARELSGYLYMPNRHISERYVDEEDGSVLLNELRHVWVEYYVPGTGWVMADPTFTYTYKINGLTQKFIDWDYFSAITMNRRYIFFRNGSTDTEEVGLHHTGGWLAVDYDFSLVAGKDYLPFNDINGHWAVDAIVYNVERGLFNGVDPAHFAPERPLTRSMFVTVLGRLFEARGGQTIPYSSDITQFTDIKEDAYYAKYLGWALDAQLIQGYGEGRFGPDDLITREQMAKIVADFLAMMELDTSLADELPPDFIDASLISEWALPGVDYCATSGLITGQPDGAFQPQREANRSQTAVILQRLDALLDTLLAPPAAAAEAEAEAEAGSAGSPDQKPQG